MPVEYCALVIIFEQSFNRCFLLFISTNNKYNNNPIFHLAAAFYSLGGFSYATTLDPLAGKKKES